MNIKHITLSALLIAVLVGWQALSRSILPGTTLVTGAGVNFILIIATTVGSLQVGLSVAAVSPIMAQLLGIAPPFWVLVPILAAANIMLVLTWHMFSHKKLLAVIFAPVAKYAIVYAGVEFIAINLMGTVFPPLVLAAFGIRQLFTALIGGGLAFITIPVLNKALKR